MQWKSARHSVFVLGRYLEIFGALGLSFVAFIFSFDQADEAYSNWPPFVLSHFAWVQANSYYVLLTLSSMVVIGVLARLKGDPWVWEKISFILNRYQAKAFNHTGEVLNHQHRVTLFQRKQFAFFVERGVGHRFWKFGKGAMPWSGWLKPVLRSGHTTQKTKAIFLAPDDATLAEGLAGQAWAGNTTVIRDDLPDLNVENPSNRAIKIFARKTFCPEPMVRYLVSQKKHISRSIAAIPVEVNGEIWGVVVLDSINPNGVTSQSVVDYELTVALIGQLLEKA